MKDKSNQVLKDFLVEGKLLTLDEFELLREDTRTDALREIANTILRNVANQMGQVGTAPIDRSFGDIKKLKEITSLQDALTNLEVLVERSETELAQHPELNKYINEIVKAIFNINKHSNVFKDAYRDKKTVLILKYQALVLSIFSAVSYLISVMVDFSSGGVEVKSDIKYEEIAPLKAIMSFNSEVESGSFKRVVDDVNTLKEHFSEFADKEPLTESSEILGMVLSGLNTLLNDPNNKELISFLYKAAGIVVLILSLRDVLYSFFRNKTKMTEIISSIEDFAGVNTSGMGTVNKLDRFSEKYKLDAEEASKMAERDTEAENKQLASKVRTMNRREMPAYSSEDEFDIGF
jgi:hypothetical protein